MPHTVQYLTGNIRMSSTLTRTPLPYPGVSAYLIKILYTITIAPQKLFYSILSLQAISHGELLQSNFLTQVPDVMTKIFLFTLPEMIATHLIKIKYSLDYFIQIIKRSRKKKKV